MGKIADTLREAKALIADEKNWCQLSYAKNAAGEDCVPGTDLDAVCFCSIGALQRISSAVPGAWKYQEHCERFLNLAAQELDRRLFVIGYNDSHTHPEVMQLWDNAISLAEKEELAQ